MPQTDPRSAQTTQAQIIGRSTAAFFPHAEAVQVICVDYCMYGSLSVYLCCFTYITIQQTQLYSHRTRTLTQRIGPMTRCILHHSRLLCSSTRLHRRVRPTRCRRRNTRAYSPHLTRRSSNARPLSSQQETMLVGYTYIITALRDENS